MNDIRVNVGAQNAYASNRIAYDENGSGWMVSTVYDPIESLWNTVVRHPQINHGMFVMVGSTDCCRPCGEQRHKDTKIHVDGDPDYINDMNGDQYQKVKEQ